VPEYKRGRIQMWLYLSIGPHYIQSMREATSGHTYELEMDAALAAPIVRHITEGGWKLSSWYADVRSGPAPIDQHPSGRKSSVQELRRWAIRSQTTLM